MEYNLGNTNMPKTRRQIERLLAAPAPTEHEEQSTVIDWCRASQGIYPELKWIHAIPNGAKLPYKKDSRGKRYAPQAQKLIAEGMLAGVPDLFLPVARGPYHGLYIEMKRHPNKPEPEQVNFIGAVRENGYKAEICWNAMEAIQLLTQYLQISEKRG